MPSPFARRRPATTAGYLNGEIPRAHLCHLITDVHIDDYYYKPRIDPA